MQDLLPYFLREKFESKPHHSRAQPTRRSQKHQEEPIVELEPSREGEVSETDVYNASKFERRERSSFKATAIEQGNTRQAEDRMLKKESRKEYPLRSVVERNGETDIRRRDNVDVSGFQWVSKCLDKLSMFQEGTAVTKINKIPFCCFYVESFNH